jgi:hypothetical protein
VAKPLLELRNEVCGAHGVLRLGLDVLQPAAVASATASTAASLASSTATALLSTAATMVSTATPSVQDFNSSCISSGTTSTHSHGQRLYAAAPACQHQ